MDKQQAQKIIKDTFERSFEMPFPWNLHYQASPRVLYRKAELHYCKTIQYRHKNLWIGLIVILYWTGLTGLIGSIAFSISSLRLGEPMTRRDETEKQQSRFQREKKAIETDGIVVERSCRFFVMFLLPNELPRRGIQVFAFLLERQKNPEDPVYPV